MSRKSLPSRPRDIVTLADLAPQHRVVGGSRQRVFGAGVDDRPVEGARVGTGKAGMDRPARTADVKAGKKR